MPRIAIIYGTSEGQTLKVSERIGTTLEQQRDSVDIFHGANLSDEFELLDYDGIIVGASLHYTRFQRYIKQFIKDHVEGLTRTPSGFFSVSLGVIDDPEGINDISEDFVESLNWRPDRIANFAGALKYTKYNPVTRFMMKLISSAGNGETDTSRDYEYTDWEQVESFAKRFRNQVEKEIEVPKQRARQTAE